MKSPSLLVVVIFVITLGKAALVLGQSTAPTTYDVSTIKPSAAGDDNMGLSWSHAELVARNVTLEWIMTSAFHARVDQISGEPSWAKDQRFDIRAKLTDVDPATLEKMTSDQHRALLLTLLVERFRLTYHVETKELPTFDLLPAKRGLKLTPAADTGDKTKQVLGLCSGCSSWGNHQVKSHDVDVPTFIELLAGQVGREIVDRTEYKGKIDASLKWAPDLGSRPASDEDAALPPLQQALEEQLGLHLVSSKGPVKVYVIDRLDKPAAN